MTGRQVPGRRSSRQRGRGGRGLALAALLPLAAGGLVAVGAMLPSDPPARPPSDAPVAQVDYACLVDGRLDVAAGQLQAGDSALATTLPDGTAVDDLTDPATWRSTSVRAEIITMEQAGAGTGAVGFVAGRAAGGDGGGLVVGGCPGVIDEAWFVGLGSSAKHRSAIVLTNLGDAPAVADLELWGARGPVEAVDNIGIVVDPRSTRTVELDSVAAGEPELGVRVVRQRGALTAAAFDASTSVARGTEIVSPSGRPSRELRMGAIPAGDESRSVLLLNPGTATARATIEVTGEEGEFTPEGLGDVKVGAGAVTVVELPDGLGDEDVTIGVVADQPLVGAVRLVTASDDLALVESGVPLVGPAVVPVVVGRFSERPILALTAAAESTSVDIEAFDAQMRSLTSLSVPVPAGVTTRVALGSREVLDADDVAYVVVTPSGGVIGSATYRSGGRLANLALEPAPTTRPGPDVRPAG